jgi:hypothetical protein
MIDDSAKPAEFSVETAQRIVHGVTTAERLAKRVQFRKNYPPPSTGFAAVRGVVLSCECDPTTEGVTVTCARLLGIPYSYDPAPDTDEQIIADAGVAPFLRAGSQVLLVRHAPLSEATTIHWTAIPLLSGVKETMNMEDVECAAEFDEPCAATQNTDPCVEI